MTLQVCVLGIDGSGKSSLCRVLPRLLAAEFACVAGSCSDDFVIVTPDEDLALPHFKPSRRILAVRLARFFKRRAKQFVNNPRRYPLNKLAHYIFQDSAAFKLSRRHHLDVMVSDGDLMLSVTGRAANYRRPASAGKDNPNLAPQAHDLVDAYAYILDGRPIPQESASRLPPLKSSRMAYRFLRALGIRAGLLPDLVIFLDMPPGTALRRIGQRGGNLDRHENEADLEQARQMYQQTLAAFREYRPGATLVNISCGLDSIGQTLAKSLAAIREASHSRPSDVESGVRPLGTTAQELTGVSLAAKLLRVPYLLHYLVRHWSAGSWREPLFVFSKPGRRFLKLGYSAEVMRDIYDQHQSGQTRADRAFFNYPLHRAVYDRLQILVSQLAARLTHKGNEPRTISIFSAPSGFAYDVFGALASLDPAIRSRCKFAFTAVDLDPYHGVEPYLIERAAQLGVVLNFVRADLTRDVARQQFHRHAPFDVALFVGLSSWLPKPQTINHLRWLRTVSTEDGCLVTDCFTPAPYSLSGKYVGYKANYYEPDVYAAMLDYCGWNGPEAEIHSGRDSINHVMLASPRKECK